MEILEDLCSSGSISGQRGTFEIRLTQLLRLEIHFLDWGRQQNLTETPGDLADPPGGMVEIHMERQSNSEDTAVEALIPGSLGEVAIGLLHQGKFDSDNSSTEGAGPIYQYSRGLAEWVTLRDVPGSLR